MAAKRTDDGKRKLTRKERREALAARRASRRGFFRLGLDELRTGALETAKAVGTAARELGEVAAELQQDLEPPAPPIQPTAGQQGPPQFHRARVRQLAEPPQGRTLIRPPGALPEADFLTACTRCRDCVEACPEGSIVRAGPQHGRALEMTPYVIADSRPCAMCPTVPCAAACTTGALRPISVAGLRIATAVVHEERCLNTQGQSCDACLPACPLSGSALVLGDGGIPVVDPSVCTGCGACVKACRSHPKTLRLVPA